MSSQQIQFPLDAPQNWDSPRAGEMGGGGGDGGGWECVCMGGWMGERRPI